MIQPPTTPVREPRPGELIGGRYIIEAELGRGGFGVVFGARHVEIDRPVAIKVLLATFAAADATAVERFRREAMIAASLGYPNSVQLYDYGETEHGVFFIVMELLQGKPLGDLISRGRNLEVHRAVHIIRQVLHALMEAHAKGIVHRDIKPENIMITPLAYDRDFVKVMDFGIAKMVGQATSQLTDAGLTLGTPRYMPVEQLRGGAVDAATDLYAVGLVLFEMLTGAPAFGGDSAVEIAMKILDGPAVHIAPDAGVPPLLCEIVNKAVSKLSVDRFQRARDFLAALDEWEPDVLKLPADGAVSRTAETMALEALGGDEPILPTLALDAAGEAAADVADGIDPTGRTMPRVTPQPPGAAAESVLDEVEASMGAKTVVQPAIRAPGTATPPSDKLALMLVLQGVALVLLVVLLIAVL